MPPTDVHCDWTHHQPFEITPDGAHILQRYPDPLALHRNTLRVTRGWQDAGGVGGLIAALAAQPKPAAISVPAIM